MPTIDATPGGSDANSYLTLVEAAALMETTLQADAWTALSDTLKQRHLLVATRLVDQYTAWPPKRAAAQALAFPTSKESAVEIPAGVKRAIAEQLAGTLEGAVTVLKKMQAEGMTSGSLLGMNASFEKDESRLVAGARRELDRLLHSYQTIVAGKAGWEGPLYG